MRRQLVAAVFVGVMVTVALADAAPNPPPTYRIEVARPDRAGARLAIVCASLEEDALNWGLYANLSFAALDIFGDRGEVGTAFTTTADDKSCVAVYAIGEGAPPKPVGMGATVTHGSAPLSTARSAVEIRVSGACPYKVKNQAGRRCTPGRVDFFQVFGTQSTVRACDLFIDDEFPIQNIELGTAAPWKSGERLAGRETTLPPRQVVPALLELGCGKSTSRSRTLARAIGVPLPRPPTQPATAPPPTTTPAPTRPGPGCLLRENFVVSGAGTPRTGFRSFGLRVSFPKGSKIESGRLVDVATEERPTANALGDMLRWWVVQRGVSPSLAGSLTREYLVNVSYKPNETGFALSRALWRFSIAYEPPRNTTACAARATEVRR